MAQASRHADPGHPWPAPVALRAGGARDAVPGDPDPDRDPDVVLGLAVPGVSAARMVDSLVRELLRLVVLDAGDRHLAQGGRADHAGGDAARHDGGLWPARLALALRGADDDAAADADGG